MATLRRSMSFAVPDVAMDWLLDYIQDPRDRAALSLVCHNWYAIDANTRKHVTISLCYSARPDRLCSRFPHLESVKIKGKPRASMFQNLIPEDWGGYAGPWVAVMADGLIRLKSVHFRRMTVTDEDIGVLVRGRGHMLETLKLDKCSGFSTDGLLLIARTCRKLQHLFLEESTIDENDTEWLHELAIHNSVLESLNFFSTNLGVSWKDLELIAQNCRSLVSVKISDCDVSYLVGFFKSATALEEFGGGSFSDEVEVSKYERVHFSPSLSRLSLSFMGTKEMHVVFPFATALKKLDLLFTFLSTEDHCQLIQHCPNLEVLEARDVIGDRGLEVVARTCRRLRSLRIERGDDDNGLEDEQGVVTQRGMSALAQGCPELEFLAIYVTDITNAALVSVATCCRNLRDFRLVLLDREESIPDLPLDNGVRALLIACPKITRLAIYLRPGGLSDVGLGYIGQFSVNVRWMLLGWVGESDLGLLQFSTGCPSLEKLELRGCCFTESALASAVLQLSSLKYLWVEGYNASITGVNLGAMVRPFWNIEIIPPRQEITTVNEFEGGQIQASVTHPAQILAYYSLAGQRTDFPASVIPFHPA
uniref:Coronatine-insensitive protein 1 n=1 Tax=Lilium hybrid division VII TaxID=101269 RepID=A0AA49K3T6_9LILI|nr:coronatine-insensitive protein 1 [Lilium hybrid division VII]